MRIIFNLLCRVGLHAVEDCDCFVQREFIAVWWGWPTHFLQCRNCGKDL